MGKEIFQLCDTIRETSFSLHSFLRHGHKEKIYENGLATRLRKQSITAAQQSALRVKDEDGTILGDLDIDLFMENKLIIELKAVKNLLNEHIAQVLGYMRAARIEHGLLINFGNPKLQIKKYVLSQDL